MPFDLSSPIISHQSLNPEHFLLTLEAPSIARRARPGQFVMLQVRAGTDPLLRRPMSLYRVPGGRRGRVQILYKIVGEGTRYLSHQPVGTRLRLLGPLGNGFTLPPRRRGGRVGDAARPVLVAGGIGIAIFPFVVEAMKRAGLRPRLVFGARSRRDLVAIPFFRSHRIPVTLATEDGTAGSRGFVTGPLDRLLADARRRGESIEMYVCGPNPMMRAVAALAGSYAVRCQMALEAHMPCGIGVCLGCVVRCREDDGGPPFRRVCTEGPVFEARQVML